MLELGVGACSHLKQLLKYRTKSLCFIKDNLFLFFIRFKGNIVFECLSAFSIFLGV